MTAAGDAVLEHWREHREQFRQSENQRAVLTNYVLVIAAALSGFIVQLHFELRTLPLSVLIVVTGCYGALAAAKYHERADYHLHQARALTKVLVDAGVLADHDAALADARLAHYRRYPRLHRLRLNWLWTELHLGIALYGVILIVVTALAS
jgi:hypothetical protein